eukprot:6985683-Pyramimonas_sp.AAC.1
MEQNPGPQDLSEEPSEQVSWSQAYLAVKARSSTSLRLPNLKHPRHKIQHQHLQLNSPSRPR